MADNLLLVNGDAKSIPLADKSVHLIVTSQPYFALRNYKVGAGEIGLEKSIEEYVASMMSVYAECWRVLKDSGLMWLNIGDSYSGGNNGAGWKGNNKVENRKSKPEDIGLKQGDLCLVPQRLALALQSSGWTIRSFIPWVKYQSAMPESVNGTRWEKHRIKAGDNSEKLKERYDTVDEHGGATLPGIAHMVPVEWSDCPGCPTCEPNGGLVLRRANGRPTTAHEWWIICSKGNYFWDAEAIRKGQQQSSIARAAYPVNAYGTVGTGGAKLSKSDVSDAKMVEANPAGRNRRTSDWWNESLEIAAQEAHAFAESLLRDRKEGGMVLDEAGDPLGMMFNPLGMKMKHYASFSYKMIEPIILASTSQKGYCAKCGEPWVRVVERTKGIQQSDRVEYKKQKPKYDGDLTSRSTAPKPNNIEEYATLGWRATCNCNIAETKPAIVLDIFVGSGSTLIAATNTMRRGIGLDLSIEYLSTIALPRALKSNTVESMESLPMFAKEEK